MKKIALFLCMILLVGCMLPLAVIGAETFKAEYEVLTGPSPHVKGVDCYEIFLNTSLEVLDTPQILYYWGIDSHLPKEEDGFGTAVASRDTDAHSGSYSVRFKTEQSTDYVHLLASPSIEAGETYELSAWTKLLSDCDKIFMTLTFSGKKDGVEQAFEDIRVPYEERTSKGEWTQKTVRFTAPQYASGVTIMLCLEGKGEMLWDDLSLLHITDKIPEPTPNPIKEPIKFLEFDNAGFEEDTIGQSPDPKNGWSPLNDVQITDEIVHSGEKSLKLTLGPGQSDALVERNISGFEAGATYQISAWVNNPYDYKVKPSLWINFSNQDSFSYDPTTRLGQTKKHFTLHKTDGWERIVLDFVPPKGTKAALVQVRMRTDKGTFFADDISIYMVEPPNAVNAETDETFYYTEWPEGFVEATPDVLEDPDHSKAEFSFLDLDGKVIDQKTFDPIGEGVKYVFKTAWMEELGKRYSVNMKITGPDGALIQEKTFPVYRFNRPTYLGADGVFRKNGKEYTISVGTGGIVATIERNPQFGGITVIGLVGDNHIPILERMDMCHERGLLCLILLGSPAEGSVGSAGNLNRIESTKSRVNLVKDHPALFGYKVQDEPFQKRTPEEDMIRAYETIRNIDPHHPVYVDDSVNGAFPWLFRYSDIVDIDSYSGASGNAGRVFSDIMGSAYEASKGRKPFTLLQQTFRNGTYLPTVDELRHFAYQTFFAGGHGYGFHSLNTDGSEKIPYMLRPDWQEIVNGWAKWERGFMYDCFVDHKYAFVNYSQTQDILWATFTDGKDIYAIVLNREKKAAKTAEIPLVDGAGTIKIDGYTATTMTGEEKTITGSGILSLELSPMEAVVWKITPNDAVDLSKLKASKYRDTMSYPWAYNAIATLEEKGIINEVSANWYGPQNNITRGEYAMFLVRALGLTGGAGANFADVEADAEYAKELAIGKAAGILNGVEDNKFDPEAQITRQDMMTMTSRAMSLAGNADLSAFSDSGAIADYAQAHVSAMVAEGLIKGNADGTINPLGNTTRAEAAVIMNRILAK